MYISNREVFLDLLVFNSIVIVSYSFTSYPIPFILNSSTLALTLLYSENQPFGHLLLLVRRDLNKGVLGGVVQYDTVKARLDRFEQIGILVPLPEILMSAVASLETYDEPHESRKLSFLEKAAKANAKLAQIYKHLGIEHDPYHVTLGTLSCHSSQPQVRGNLQPVMHYGTIASGNVLVKDVET